MKPFSYIFLLISVVTFGQSSAYSSAEIYDDLLRLQNNATVMYLAAHPDDENTRIISWLTHDKHVDAVYLSLTRGDGGQNLIGTEKGEMLGLLRTQELLEARKVDKGRQWFTRAVDFGYSKTTEDTYAHWDKEKILGDVVWAIRVNKPKVIITRFDPDSNGRTHGHHTASAQLAVEAFDLAADPNAYPEQLKYVKPWKVKRLFFNTSWWFYGSKEKFEKADKSQMISVDVGKYYPHLGISNNEISSLSRSKHACQGFGSALQRGSQIEWLKLLKGDMPKNNDILDGITTSWDSVELQKSIDETISEFDFKKPENSLNKLLYVYELANKSSMNDRRINQIKELILKTQGIYVEWTTKEAFGTNQANIETELEVVNRSESKSSFFYDNSPSFELKPNNKFSGVKETYNPKLEDVSSPYWLSKEIKNNLYTVNSFQDIGLPENVNSMIKNITFNLGDEFLSVDIPLQQKTVDPSLGELYEPFYVVPKFVVNFSQPHYLFKNKAENISVNVKSFVADVQAKVSLKATNGWQVSQPQSFKTKNKGETQTFHFKITPSSNFKPTELTAEIQYNGKTFSQSLQEMDYHHINRQIWLHEAKARAQNLDIKIPNVKVAYIQGSGDEVPSALRSMGVQVDELDANQWNVDVLKNYDVVMLGIRAFNTIDALQFIQQDLWNYVENGGVVITQYNTNRGLKSISPFNLKLGRDRISQEHQPLKILESKHPIFNQPNIISDKDFDNWVQERGLYFASEWDDNLTPLLEGKDVGESKKKGILLIGDYGKGKYIYTGLSFFRELPAGVPGAYRLMMNLLALGEK